VASSYSSRKLPAKLGQSLPDQQFVDGARLSPVSRHLARERAANGRSVKIELIEQE
jgi:hypothetical protein